ncbi:MAG: SusC/RagA family TonB-linked outer membrane protein [Rikenellaceae bacterium]|jgi:TonB-linked SusC/RagA family outer membrane protein|nr:SusC/RagA family TonB-linked outer membrane protein [Rikenellaceae bacterium]
MRKIVLLFLAVLATGSLLAQNSPVTGTVTSEEGEALSGVTVVLQGTQVADITGPDGKFSIAAPANGTLAFSFVGYATQEVEVSGRAQINVVMQPDAQAIDDVIVVAYGTAQKSTFTGSASSVSADDFKLARTDTPDKMLAGKTSGIRVASVTGAPGAGGEVQIRGIGSINGSTAPLYVVDGVPITSSNFTSRAEVSLLTTLNPSDIESMTVLKDAAAASLYGSRAANGVIIVTTKSGKEGRPRVTFNASLGISQMATNSYDVMSGTELYGYTMDALKNSLEDGYFTLAQLGVTTNEEFMEDVMWIKNRDGEDWQKYFYNTGIDQNYSLNVSGGTPGTKYYFGLSYQDMTGIVKDTGLKRYSFSANTSSKINNWLSLEGKAQLSYAETEGMRDNFTSNVYEASGIGSFGTNGLLAQLNPSEFLYNADGTINESASLSGSFLSPEYETSKKYKFFNNGNARALVNGNAEIRFTPNLKFRSVNGVDFVDLKLAEYWGPTTGDGGSLNGMGQDDLYRMITVNTANTLTYNNTFGENHNLDLLAGYEANSYRSEYTSAQAENYSTDKLPALSVGQMSGVGGSTTRTFMNSWFFNGNYNYGHRYYVGATVRTDKSSKLGYDNQRGVFWSVSGSWRLSGENFLVDNNTLTNARIRASYGTNGNLPGGAFGYLSAYSMGGQYGPDGAIYPTQPANPNLGWEQSKNFDFGVEFSFVRRFDFVFDYYRKVTTDLLLAVPSSVATGFGSSTQNSGSLLNRGVEFEFHGHNVTNSKNVRWDTSFFLTTLKATVTSLPNGEAVSGNDAVGMYRYEEGQDLYGFYLPKWYGVDPDNGDGLFYIDPSKGATADNLTNDYNQAQRGFVAKGYPTVNGSWNNTISWKGFSLDMLLTYQFGGSLYNYMNYFMQSGGRRVWSGWNQNHNVIGDYWQKPGDEVGNTRPVFYSTGFDLASSRWVYSSDFVRLKELALSYSLPKAVVSKLSMSDLTFTVSAYNLAYLYAASKDMELETALNGFRSPDIPLARTITFGVSVGF